MAQSFTFADLTPDLILDAIEDTGIRVDSGLLALNSYENRVYQFQDEDKTRYVVKFYRPQRWRNEQIQEEHDYALELVEHDIPLAAPLSINGKTLHHYQDYAFAVFPSVGGRQFEVDNLDQLEWMGRFIGRMHAVGARQPFSHRDIFSVQTHLHEPLQQLQQSQLIPSHLHQAFFTILEQVVQLATEHYLSALANVNHAQSIRLHGDCHPGNILWRDGPTFVDLDDCRNGPAVQDLWMMLSGDRQQQLLQLDTLVNAYEEFFEFDHAQLKLIEPLRAMRMVHYMAWLENRWQDPAFPRAFPWFAEDKYWEQQILSLKEQFSSLHEPALSLMP
ncbi:serine/threonine protein kinase [Alteromonas sp. a30]|uniref:serine/threonine protein kinase n=1 Tax=Alteromonas sp. a30 TaxID=2730917 RepID=UPI002281D47A|nr:serine/threonine protein kinase [Alteromonas sp. a30]MCY7294712.1 serine/threonine protein kinase [Alteromonas sp. a30]